MYLPSFLSFVERIDESLGAELDEVPSSGRPYPVGLLKLKPTVPCDQKPGRPEDCIMIYFVHYGDFPSAAESWKKRAPRVDRSRTVILATENAHCSESDILRFAALPFPKLLLTPFSRTACILGTEAFVIPDLSPDAFNVAGFSGWSGHRFYHRIGVSERMYRLAARCSEYHQ